MGYPSPLVAAIEAVSAQENDPMLGLAGSHGCMNDVCIGIVQRVDTPEAALSVLRRKAKVPLYSRESCGSAVKCKTAIPLP